MDLPRASFSVSSATCPFLLDIFTWLCCLKQPIKRGAQEPQLCRFQKTNGHVSENQRFCSQAHSSLWSAKRIMIPFVLIVPIVLGGFWGESVGCQACRVPALWIRRGLHLRLPQQLQTSYPCKI